MKPVDSTDKLALPAGESRKPLKIEGLVLCYLIAATGCRITVFKRSGAALLGSLKYIS